MRIGDLCSTKVQLCSRDATLSDAGWKMWEGDFGTLPVVDATGKVVGMITDRDICMAAVTKNRPASEIRVHEVITGKVYACRAEDEVVQALKIMREQQVRRLPVLDKEGRLQGILSLNDLALAARSSKSCRRGDVTGEDILALQQALCRPRPEKAQAPAAAHACAAG